MSHLAGLGPNESTPVEVSWHWYYRLPGFAPWAFIFALLVLVKENRQRYAWAILIPLLLMVAVVWPMLVRLFSLSSSSATRNGVAFEAALITWTAVWLVSPWLIRRRPLSAILITLASTVLARIVMQAWVFGHFFFIGDPVCLYTLPIFALVIAFVLAGSHCRNNYRPRRFLAWLALWLAAAILLGSGFYFGCVLFARGNLEGRRLLYLLPGTFLTSLPIAASVYLANLPFMYLAFRCPPYRERFHQLLRLPQYDRPEVRPEE